MRVLFLLAIINLSGIANAQDVKGFPEDLNKEKIIFLKYEQIKISDRFGKLVKKMYTRHNKAVVESNEMLEKEAKKYPFDYVISTRAEYKDLIEQGYKYVLECDMMEYYNNGKGAVASDVRTKFYSDLYIKDLQTGDKYTLFEISDTYLIRYDKLMQKFNQKVKKNFDVK